GRSQLALLRLEGETLVVRPVHFLDLGRERRLPLRETSEWWLRVGGYRGQRYKDLAFRHGGKTWRFYLFEPDWPALEPLEALVTERFGAGWQEAFDDHEAHYAGREKRDLSA